MPTRKNPPSDLSDMPKTEHNHLYPGRTRLIRRPGWTKCFGTFYASRDAYAEEHGNDLDRIFADLTRREKTSEERVFREPE